MAGVRGVRDEVQRVAAAGVLGAALVVEVEQPIDTVLIKVTARAGTPLEAQQLADAWIAALADQVDQIEDPRGRDRAGTLKVVPVESAELPTAPVSPQTDRNVLLGLAAMAGSEIGAPAMVIRRCRASTAASTSRIRAASSASADESASGASNSPRATRRIPSIRSAPRTCFRT